MHCRLNKTRCLLLMVACVSSASILPADHSNSLMDISADGTLLACSNRDSGSVTIVDLKTHSRLREITVGHKPEGVTFIGDSHRLACCVYQDDVIAICDADSGAVLNRIDVFDEPYGIISTTDGKRLFATLDYPGEILVINPATGRIERSVRAGEFLRGVALTPDEKTLLVCEYYTSVVRGFDTASWSQTLDRPGSSADNLARQLTVSPRRPKAYVPHIRSRVVAAHGSGSIFPYISVVDTEDIPDSSRPRKRIPMDTLQRLLVVANPWEVAISPDGQLACTVFSGTDDLYVSRIIDDNYEELGRTVRGKLGSNPRAVRFARDGSTFYVYNALDFQVIGYDASSLEEVATVDVCENPLSEQVHRGKVLFYTANNPMSGRRWISCSGCHPDGDADGRTWQNPEGLRNTPPLGGLAWTHPLHWSADRDEVQDFEHTIRGLLMQGRGLIKGRVHDSLAAPNRGLSADADAMAAYTNSHSIPLSPHAKDGLSTAATRGRKLFFSTETKCASCHSGPYYSDSRPNAEFIVHDVGTGNDDPTELMGPKYDTPTLLGVYRSAPYLHHGKAATLEEVLTIRNVNDQHGKTSHLTSGQIDDLVEFLKCLPYEDPEPAAIEAGLTKIVD